MTRIELFQARKWNAQVEFPTSWDELSTAEMLTIGLALDSDQSRQELLLEMIAGRARMQAVKLPIGWQTLLNFEDAAAQGLILIDNLLGNNDRTINPLPVLKSYYGPKDAFGDMTVGEWEEAEICFAQYSLSREVKHLTALAAVLWRPLTGGQRVSHAGYQPDIASFSRRVSGASLHVIHLWYAGCRAQLVAIFPDVFAGGGSEERDPDLSAITRLIHGGAGPKNGTRAEVRATLIKEFLFECQIAAEQAAEMEREMKKMR